MKTIYTDDYWKEVKEKFNNIIKNTTKGPKTNSPDKEFIRIFKNLSYRHSPLIVWSDFITLFSCSISNVFDKDNYKERENLYLKTINKYIKTEQDSFSKLAAQIIIALDNNPEQDFLGNIFMRLDLGNNYGGQFFTPYSVCQCMASISVSKLVDQIINGKEYVAIHDPACGAGATLIAGINEVHKEFEKEKLNFQDYVLVTGQDIDQTVALMCYIQISLLGVAGYIKVGDSLLNPMKNNDSLENYWLTPMYFFDIWKARKYFNNTVLL